MSFRGRAPGTTLADTPPVAPFLRVRFDRGTLELLADGRVRDVPRTAFDPRSNTLRAAASALRDIATWADGAGVRLEGDPRDAWRTKPGSSLESLGLRSYQLQAIGAWEASGRRGVLALPTGAGKTRIAIGVMRATGLPSAVLCPTRALARAWVEQLERWLEEPIGMVGDGVRRIERNTVMTFESAFRCMDELGPRSVLGDGAPGAHGDGTGTGERRGEAARRGPRPCRLRDLVRRARGNAPRSASDHADRGPSRARRARGVRPALEDVSHAGERRLPGDSRLVVSHVRRTARGDARGTARAARPSARARARRLPTCEACARPRSPPTSQGRTDHRLHGARGERVRGRSRERGSFGGRRCLGSCPRGSAPVDARRAAARRKTLARRGPSSRRAASAS